ncbi:MAG: hypothetical protein V4538_02500 [Bacteroidota bacterium]
MFLKSIFVANNLSKTMDAKQKRLNLVILMLNLSRNEIAEKTNYTASQISRITTGQEPTNKFINVFCLAFPKANKKYILDNDGEPLIGVDCSDIGFKSIGKEKQEISFLKQQIAKMDTQITYLQNMLEKALSLQPDLAGKLNYPIAKYGKQDSNYTLNLFTQLGTTQGAFKN